MSLSNIGGFLGDDSGSLASFISLKKEESEIGDESPQLAAVPPNSLMLDKLGEDPKIPPIDLHSKYKKMPSGTTKPARHFQLTLNQVERWQELKEYLESLKNLDYGVAGMESAPSTGHQHIHAYIHFNKTQRLQIKKLQGSHIEQNLKGTPKQNIDYVKKDGDVIWEKGDPLFYKKKLLKYMEEDKENDGFMGTPSIKEVKEMEKEDREDLPINFYKTVQVLNKIDDDKLTAQKDNKPGFKALYIQGDSGKGKSLLAKYLFFKENLSYDKVVKKGDFWHGVTGTNYCCIYDDFRDSHMAPSEFINFVDSSISTMNIKNGSVQNLYKYIIITSVQSLDELYYQANRKARDMGFVEPKTQWIRRLRKIDIDKVVGEGKKFNIPDMLKEMGYLDDEEDPKDPFKCLFEDD